jgi:hypothetical protein
VPIRRSVPKPIRLTAARQRSRFLRPARVDPPPAYPTLKQDTSGTVTTSSALTFAAAPVSGNLLVVAVAGDKASGALTLSPGSWTVEQNLQSASVSDYIAWKVSDGSETTITASVAVPGGNASGWAGEIQQTGTGTWTVLGTQSHVTDENATGYTSWDTGTTAAIAADGIGVAVVAKDSFGSGDTGGTWSNGYTARYKSTVTGGQAGLYVGIKAPETSGTAATSTVTGTGTPSSDQMSGAIAVFARSAPTLIPGNLLTLNQQDVETDASGWTGINATVGRTSSNPHTGTWALTTTSQAAGDTEAVASTRFGITPGHGCTLTGWCRPSADRNALVYIAWYAGGVWQSVDGGTLTAVTAGTYTQVSVSAVAPAGVDEALVNLRVTSVGAGEAHQWDTISALDTGAAGINVPAETATGTGTAGTASVDIAVAAGQPTATGLAPDSLAAVGVNAEAPVGAGTAPDAASDIQVNAGSPAGVGAAQDATAAVTVAAEQPTATGQAFDATVSTASATNAPAEAATGTGVASDALAAVAANAGQPTGTGAAQDATVALAANAESPSAVGTAYDATVSTVGNVTAPAEAASGTGTANDALAAVTVNAEAPGASGTAGDATASLGVNAEASTGSGSAFAGSAAVGANAEQPTATGVAFDATVSTLAITNAPAEAAVGTGAALDATPSVGANAGQPTAAGQAFDATVSTVVQTNAPAEVAIGIGSAFDASVVITFTAQAPSAIGTADNALSSVGATPAAASGTGAAFDTGLAITVNAGIPVAVGAAPDAMVTYDLTLITLGEPYVTGDVAPMRVTGDPTAQHVTGDRVPAEVH